MKASAIGFFLFFVSLPATLNAAVITSTFQHGVDGYTAVLDRRIAATASSEVNGSAVNTDAASYFIDGGASALNDAGVTQGLLRFDNIVGGTGIPAGAKVLSATVDLVTGNTSNAQSGGAYNMYRLTTAFDSTSTWAGTFGGNGLTGDVGEILGSFEDLTAGSNNSARADKAVQMWVDGGSNLGFGIRSDQNIDGWSPHTTGSATVSKHPKLTVTYTTDPLVNITSYQQGVNSYAGTKDLRFNSADGTATDGATTDQIFLDGFDAAAASPDQSYLLRFDGLNLNFPAIYKAELVIKTGFSSTNADTPGPFNVHQMLKDWNTSTTYASLDSNGDPTLNGPVELQAGGTIGPVATAVTGINDTEVMYIDVTSIVENWRAGQPNYGFYIGTPSPAEGGTSNGWQIFLTGAPDSSFRPELRIIAVPEPAGAAILMMVLGGAVSLGRRTRQK